MNPQQKTRPIIFSSRMVNAILAGKKSQTRRIIKPQPDLILNEIPFKKTQDFPHAAIQIHCPYGKPGDHLWVKETWLHDAYPLPMTASPSFYYKADLENTFPHKQIQTKWITPLFMPRIASRFLLKVIDVRLERLTECSLTDAIAEGVDSTPDNDALSAFKKVWEAINGVGSWAINPWVWVIEFKRL